MRPRELAVPSAISPAWQANLITYISYGCLHYGISQWLSARAHAQPQDVRRDVCCMPSHCCCASDFMVRVAACSAHPECSLGAAVCDCQVCHARAEFGGPAWPRTLEPLRRTSVCVPGRTPHPERPSPRALRTSDTALAVSSRSRCRPRTRVLPCAAQGRPESVPYGRAASRAAAAGGRRRQVELVARPDRRPDGAAARGCRHCDRRAESEFRSGFRSCLVLNIKPDSDLKPESAWPAATVHVYASARQAVWAGSACPVLTAAVLDRQ